MNKTRTPSPEAIATSKRLRLICQWFSELNARIPGSEPDGGLSPAIVEEIRAQSFDPADLMAIRQRPFGWTKKDPYHWLWILHRYQNRYA